MSDQTEDHDRRTNKPTKQTQTQQQQDSTKKKKKQTAPATTKQKQTQTVRTSVTTVAFQYSLQDSGAIAKLPSADSKYIKSGVTHFDYNP